MAVWTQRNNDVVDENDDTSMFVAQKSKKKIKSPEIKDEQKRGINNTCRSVFGLVDYADAVYSSDRVWCVYSAQTKKMADFLLFAVVVVAWLLSQQE